MQEPTRVDFQGLPMEEEIIQDPQVEMVVAVIQGPQVEIVVVDFPGLLLVEAVAPVHPVVAAAVDPPVVEVEVVAVVGTMDNKIELINYIEHFLNEVLIFL
jgi:hypothetical protein